MSPTLPKSPPLRLEWIEAGTLAENPANWRRHPEGQVSALKGIIGDPEVGWAGACLYNERTKRLIDGHARRNAVDPKTPIPVLVGSWSEAAEKKILLTLDPLAGMAVADAEALKALMDEVTLDGDALKSMVDDLATTLQEAEAERDRGREVVEDEVPDASKVETRCKPGDLWRLGNHRLLCGDSTKADDVARLMDGVKAGMMVTDPPYGVDYEGGQANSKKREKLSGDDTTDVFNAGLSAALNAVPSGAWYIWHAGRYAEPVYVAIRKCGFDVRALIVWNKLKAHYGAPSAHYCQKHEPCLYAVRESAGFCGPSNEVTVWDIEQPHHNEYHPTQKPVVCMARAIRNHDAESVYDPFLGSGTTLIAAEQLGRKCYGMEISPTYCDVILARWEKLTGKKAERA